MSEIVWRKFSRHFDPMQYPLTDLIEETTAKKWTPASSESTYLSKEESIKGW